MAIKILSKAPTRIDLAGGTLDIWPLYLFLKNPLTVNVGIDLFAEARLEQGNPKPGGEARVTLRAEDQNAELTIEWDKLAELQAPPALELHAKLLRYYSERAQIIGWKDCDLTLVTRAKSPAGAGLGGSSALSVAMIGALGTWARGGGVNVLQEGESLIDVVRDVETTVIKVPAGLQDYYGAMFGGLQSLRWEIGRHRRQWLPESLLTQLQSRLLLFYSGQSRNSGINNWALFKGLIDNEGEVRAKFEAINHATQRLEGAMLRQDWTAVGTAIAEEWKTRRTLAAGITTPEIDRGFAKAMEIAPNAAGKICGAGGGGCFFVYVPSPEDKTKVEQALVAEGLRALPLRLVPRGLEVQVTRA